MSNDRTYTVGQILTAAQVNDLPQGILGITRVTADFTNAGSPEVDVITAPAVTLVANRRIRISFHAATIGGSVANDQFVLTIKEGTTGLNEAWHFVITVSGFHSGAVNFSHVIDAPSAGSHTYKVTLFRNAGTGTCTMSASASRPMFLTVEDCGSI